MDATNWADVVRRIEAEGFSTLLVADHLVNPMACAPLMLGAALRSTTLRVGSYVFDNDFRHPAVLAKEAATIDLLAKGRVELGLGAGWFKPEYDAVGLPFDPPGVRAGRLEEAVDIISRLLSGATVTYHGNHYQLSGFEGTPLPTQTRIPLLIGGGAPRIIKLAARRADIASFTPRSLPGGGVDPGDVGPDAMDAKVALLKWALTQAGRGHEEVERTFSSSPSPLQSPASPLFLGPTPRRPSHLPSPSSVRQTPWSRLCTSAVSAGDCPTLCASRKTWTPLSPSFANWLAPPEICTCCTNAFV